MRHLRRWALSSRIVLTDGSRDELATYREAAGKQSEEWSKKGRCVTCGCNLKRNLDRGILICAGTHRKQYADYKNGLP